MLTLIVSVAVLSTATGTAQNSVYRNLKAHKVVASWDEAQRICHREGGYLASPIDAIMLNNMKHFIDSSYRSDPYLIGTRALEFPGQYISLEGVELEDMPVFDMLERLDASEGDCLSMDESTIRVKPCWSELPFICRLNVTDDLLCGKEGYQYHMVMDKCYKHYSASRSRKTWDDAEAACVEDGSHLVVLDDSYEAEAIHKLYPKRFVCVFIGIRDRTKNGNWTSIDGTRVENLYNVWEEGRKPVGESSKFNDCGVIRNSGKIDNYPCNRTYPFICEKRPDPNMFLFKKTKL